MGGGFNAQKTSPRCAFRWIAVATIIAVRSGASITMATSLAASSIKSMVWIPVGSL